MIDSKFTQYAEDVLSGKIIAGELIKLCCERYLSWFDRDDIYFDEESASKPVRFISKLRHFTGDHAGKHFILQDWQEFLVYNIFGWIRKDNNTRLIRNAYIQISRKCGKTSLASALGLYGLIADNEAAAEVTCVAPSAEQSRIAFKNASYFLQSINHANLFQSLRGEIRFNKAKSRFRIMSSDAKFGDGFNPSLAIIDEYHAMKDNEIPNVLISGMGMRKQPLMLYITTAGFNLLSPCKQYRDMCEEILRGTKHDDTIFPMIYELDEDDDINDPSVWKKCCPSLGITVKEDYMQQQLTMMKNNPSDEVPTLTKTFNKWCSSASSWLPNSLIVEHSAPINLDDFKDKKLFTILGVDLAAVSDLTALSSCFMYDNKFYFKTWYFLPEVGLDESPNKAMYNHWRRTGELIVTPGNATDYNYVLNKILEVNKYLPVYGVAYDTWNSTQFTEMAVAQRIKMIPFSQALGNFNRPTKEFERLLRLDKVVIDDNEITRWCFGNCTLKVDWNDNCKPVKGSTKFAKIDGVIAMLQALGQTIQTPQGKHFFEAI